MRKYVNIVESDLEECCNMSNKSASIQPRTSSPKSVTRVLPLTLTKPGFLIYRPGSAAERGPAGAAGTDAAGAPCEVGYMIRGQKSGRPEHVGTLACHVQ